MNGSDPSSSGEPIGGGYHMGGGQVNRWFAFVVVVWRRATIERATRLGCAGGEDALEVAPALAQRVGRLRSARWRKVTARSVAAQAPATQHELGAS